MVAVPPSHLPIGEPGHPRPGARAGLPSRTRMWSAYWWRNSGHPLGLRLRAAWETRDGAVAPAVVSHLGGLSVAYTGLPEGVAHTLEFTEHRRAQPGELTARRVSQRLRAADLQYPARLPDADIVITGTSTQRARSLSSAATLVMPMKVHLVVDIDGDAESLRRRISKRERSQFSRGQREHDWNWQVETDPARFDLFYHRMYRPTMQRRHGVRERTESAETAYECLFRGGRLFLLHQNDRPVAGALCHWAPRSGTLTLRLLGVLDGAAEHYASGAFKAVYHYLVSWAGENDVSRVDFQGTEPFLSKGTFQWKRRFGSRVIIPPTHFGAKRLCLSVRRDTPAVRDFLVGNPVLVECEDGSLEAVYFTDSQRPPRLDFSAKAPGVDRIREVDLDDFLCRLSR
ncbi:GNAT family N-acetyltransferase [Streptomyces sp. YGL11-2]|uniref:GNAT family N-acetyltransferase n=1 Tax=Streptomyces sp. YGL11-2 TaxID=3414028 RepID=UPI003CEC5F8D